MEPVVNNNDELLALTNAAKRGDPNATATLLRALQDTLYRYCLAQLSDVHQAYDATQETAMRLLRSLPKYRQASSVKTWALGIALNVCREQRRQPRATSLDFIETVTTQGDRGPVVTLEAKELSQRLREHIQQLPDRQREAIILRYFEELTLQETATVMNCAVGTVKATLWQALRHIRQKLESQS